MGRWLCALFTVDWQEMCKGIITPYLRFLLLPAYSPRPTPAANDDEIILRSHAGVEITFSAVLSRRGLHFWKNWISEN